MEATELPPCAPTYDLKVRCCCHTIYHESEDDPTGIPGWFARGLEDLAAQGEAHAELEAGGLGTIAETTSGGACSSSGGLGTSSALEKPAGEPAGRGLGGGDAEEERGADSEAESAALFQPRVPPAEGVS